MTKSKIFLWFCLAFVGGIFLNSLIKTPQLIWLGVLVLGILLISIWWLRKKIVVLGSCLLVLVGGIIWHDLTANKARGQKIKNAQIVFKGVVIKEPEIRIDNVKLVVKNEQIGKVLVTTGLYPEYKYGDEIEIAGKLLTPQEFDDFNYRGYLAKDGIYSVIYYPEIKLIAKNQGSRIYQSILSFKNQLREVIHQVLSPLPSTILGAVFLGDKQKLSPELKEKLNITGTRHIVAISGMHMVIMAEILLFLALGLGLWRSQAFYFVLIFLVLYIIMIGAPASAIRAGIMASLLLLAQKIGRLRSADRAIVFAATAMLMANPLLLKFDSGFQLSFIAALSIIYLKPILDKKIDNWPNPLGLRDILTMTLAAQIGTLPLLVFHFGRLSLISPLANLLIVPFLPMIMISGLILSLVGLIYLPLAKILAWPVWFLLSYVIKIIDYLSFFPLAAYEFNPAPNVPFWCGAWVILAGYYLILGMIVLRKRP
jgi:competence protein ComEC